MPPAHTPRCSVASVFCGVFQQPAYYGLDKLSLNNLIQDATMMKDYLTYTMMQSFGVSSSLCSFVYITVNGEDWGLYLAVEGVEEAFLERNYGADYGELYKPDSMSFGGGRGNGKDFNMDEFDFASAESQPDESFEPPSMPEGGQPQGGDRGGMGSGMGGDQPDRAAPTGEKATATSAQPGEMGEAPTGEPGDMNFNSRSDGEAGEQQETEMPTDDDSAADFPQSRPTGGGGGQMPSGSLDGSTMASTGSETGWIWIAASAAILLLGLAVAFKFRR